MVGWRRALAALRFDGGFWRRLAYLGSVYGPEWLRRGAPPLVGLVIFALAGRNRRGAIENLRRVRGSRGALRDALGGLRTFAEFAYCVEETLELEGRNGRGAELGARLMAELDIETPADLDLDALCAGGRGLIVLTSHFGCWEMGARVMQVIDRPVHLVMAHETNPTVEAFQRENLEAHGIRVIRSNASQFASVEMIRALGRGEIVAVQLDRAAPGQVTRPIEFFGSPAPFPPGPFVLARLSGAPLWPVFVARLGRRHFRFFPEALRYIKRDASDCELKAVMRDVVGTFEARVREHPHQWFQFAPFWDR